MPADTRLRPAHTQVENQNSLLKALKAAGIKLGATTADELADGKPAALLALSWGLMSHFSGVDAEGQALTEWAAANVGSVEGVSTAGGWAEALNDGLLLCALLHTYDNEALDFKALRTDLQDNASLAAATLEEGFAAAEKRYGAPRLLDAEDVVAGEAGTRATVVYVAKLRQALRTHSVARRRGVMERCAAFEAGTKQLEDWADEEKAALVANTATVMALPGHGRVAPPANEEEAEAAKQAEELKVALDAEFRQVGHSPPAHSPPPRSQPAHSQPAHSQPTHSQLVHSQLLHSQPAYRRGPPAPGPRMAAPARGHD